MAVACEDTTQHGLQVYGSMLSTHTPAKQELCQLPNHALQKNYIAATPRTDCGLPCSYDVSVHFMLSSYNLRESNKVLTNQWEQFHFRGSILGLVGGRLLLPLWAFCSTFVATSKYTQVAEAVSSWGVYTRVTICTPLHVAKHVKNDCVHCRQYTIHPKLGRAQAGPHCLHYFSATEE